MCVRAHARMVWAGGDGLAVKVGETQNHLIQEFGVFFGDFRKVGVKILLLLNLYNISIFPDVNDLH